MIKYLVIWFILVMITIYFFYCSGENTDYRRLRENVNKD